MQYDHKAVCAALRELGFEANLLPTREDLKQRFKRLALEHHPDKARSRSQSRNRARSQSRGRDESWDEAQIEQETKEATNKFQRISQAHDLIYQLLQAGFHGALPAAVAEGVRGSEREPRSESRFQAPFFPTGDDIPSQFQSRRRRSASRKRNQEDAFYNWSGYWEEPSAHDAPRGPEDPFYNWTGPRENTRPSTPGGRHRSYSRDPCRSRCSSGDEDDGSLHGGSMPSAFRGRGIPSQRDSDHDERYGWNLLKKKQNEAEVNAIARGMVPLPTFGPDGKASGLVPVPAAHRFSSKAADLGQPDRPLTLQELAAGLAQHDRPMTLQEYKRGTPTGTYDANLSSPTYQGNGYGCQASHDGPGFGYGGNFVSRRYVVNKYRLGT